LKPFFDSEFSHPGDSLGLTSIVDRSCKFATLNP
jgi:hypothetical protein